MGRRFMEVAGEKARKRKDETWSRVMAVPSTNILLDITMTSFAIIFNTTNEFITGINILLFAGFTQVWSGLIYVDRLRRISYTIVITPTHWRGHGGGDQGSQGPRQPDDACAAVCTEVPRTPYRGWDCWLLWRKHPHARLSPPIGNTCL